MPRLETRIKNSRMSNAIRSHIFIMPSASWKPGMCWLCDEAVLLKFRDQTTGMCVGSCCVEALVRADSALFNANKDGIRSPTHEEAGEMPNH